MEEIFALRTVDELEAWCARQPVEAARRELIGAFEWYRRGRTASAWNRLVIVCEALAILGWGDVRPVEAVARPWPHKQILTELQYRNLDHSPYRTLDELFGGRCTWSLWYGNYVPTDAPREVRGDAKRIRTQRVPVPSSPLRITTPGFHTARKHPFQLELERARQLLNLRLAKPYGPGFEAVDLLVDVSYPVFERQRGVSYFHEEAEVVHRPGVHAYLVPRMDIRRLNGRQKPPGLTVHRCYSEVELKRPLPEQKAEFLRDIAAIMDALEVKLRKKSPLYRLAELRADLMRELQGWL